MGLGLPVPSQKPGQNASTEQGHGDNCEGERRQPDWHVVHIEEPDKCGNYDVATIEGNIQQTAAAAPLLTVRLRLTFAAPQVGGQCEWPGNRRQ
jgi:hypothetical protein